MACFDVRRPTLSCLNSEQSEHCGGHVVVVELLLGPHPGHHHWRFAPVSELKKLSLNQVYIKLLNDECPMYWCCTWHSSAVDLL